MKNKDQVIGAIQELEYILKEYDDPPFSSPFNPKFTWLCIQKRLKERLYRKKYYLMLAERDKEPK